MAPATVPSFFLAGWTSLMNFSKPILSLVLVSGGFAFAQATSNAATSASPLYKVVDGTKVDADTMKGFRTWRAAACDRCHGANQEGMVGPSLIESLKTLSKDDFVKTLTEGRLEKGMPAWKTNKQVMDNIDHLYAYLKGRSDGAITHAKVEEIK
jgi:mono/diheme cytochrome c family protein